MAGIVDFSGTPECSACFAGPGLACEPGCPTWASDDLPLVGGSVVAEASALLGGRVFPNDDPWTLPGAFVPPF